MENKCVDETSIDITISTKTHIDLEKKYIEADETKDIIVDERGGCFEFNTQFTYLGSIVTFLLDDMVDVKYRIIKASKAMGVLKTIWEAKEVLLESKIKLYEAIPVNLLLWGSENWSGN